MSTTEQTESVSQKERQLMLDALQALKDIQGAASNGEPYTEVELCAVGGFVDEILNRKTDLCIELDGESFT